MDTTKLLLLKKRGISPIWILPAIAIGLCLWIFFKSYQNAGIEISIYFDDASGITPGKTQIIAKGIPVGLVKEVHVDLDNQRIQTVARMDKAMEKYLVEDILFWVVRPEISGTKIQGLETILSGSYISVQAGSSKVKARSFTGLPSPPPISEEAPGLHLVLKADSMRSIQMGSGIYYKNIQIGTVQNYTLESNKSVKIKLHIKPKFTDLVRKGSRFSNASGITLSGKLTNMKLHMESFASLIMGGIVLSTPEELEDTPPAVNGDIFPLYRDKEAAKFGLNMTLELASGAGIIEGVTKVRYRGLDAGIVEKISFNNDERHTVTAQILLDPQASIILKEGTKFWLVEPQIQTGGIKNLSTIISGPYITFTPGNGPYTNHFKILPSEPSLPPLRPGKEFHLTVNDPNRFSTGSPILYKNIQVGEIVAIDLEEQKQFVELRIYIYEQYLHLLEKTSVFWDTSGIRANVDLSGIRVETGPLSSVLQGGISFTTPPVSSPEESEPAVEGDRFTLHSSYNEAIKNVPSMLPPGYYFRVKAKNLGPYKQGSPILYKKVKVGEVLGFSFSQKYQDVLIDCLIHEPYVDMVNTSSRFFDYSGIQVDADLSGVSMQTGSLESILQGGIGFTTPHKAKKAVPHDIFRLFSTKEAALMADDLPIHVTFKESNGMKVGTPVKYKGVRIGQVSAISFSKDMQTIRAKLRLKRETASFFRKTTKIWLVKPRIKLSEIRNPDTLISGPYITFEPGKGKKTRSFTALNNPPPPTVKPGNGLNLRLISKNRGSININSPVYFRQIKVGQVTGFRLSDTFKEVHIDVNIEAPFTPIIRENTRFWNASGTKIEGGLFSGVKVSTQSLESLLTGGIALATPENDEMGKPVENNHSFKLHKHAKSEWLDWNPEIVLLKEEKKQKLQKEIKKSDSP